MSVYSMQYTVSEKDHNKSRWWWLSDCLVCVAVAVRLGLVMEPSLWFSYSGRCE